MAPTGRTLGENFARLRLPRYDAVVGTSLAVHRNTSRRCRATNSSSGRYRGLCGWRSVWSWNVSNHSLKPVVHWASCQTYTVRPRVTLYAP